MYNYENGRLRKAGISRFLGKKYKLSMKMKHFAKQNFWEQLT